MRRFKSTRHLQRFVSIHDLIANRFHLPRDNISAADHRNLRTIAMDIWYQIARLRPIETKAPIQILSSQRQVYRTP